MTTTACLPECERNCWTGQDKHAFGCPVAAMFGSAEQAYFGPRAPQAEAVCTCNPNCFGCECNCHYSIRPAPQAEDGGKVHGDDCVDDCNGCTCWCHPKPAPAPEPKQGSEEPIDWDAAKASSESWAKGRPLPHDLKCTPAQETLGRAYLSLRAEVEKLQGIIMGSSTESRVTLGVNLRRYWSAEDQAMLGRMLFDEDVPKLLAELDAAKEEIAENGALCVKLAAEKARADKAEQRVRELEDLLVRMQTAEAWTSGPWKEASEAARAILRARQEQKEGGR